MRNHVLVGATLLQLSCAGSLEPTAETPAARPRTEDVLGEAVPARPLPTTDVEKKVAAALDGFYQRTATRRAYIMTDKPLYQPGETIWFRVDLRYTASLVGV